MNIHENPWQVADAERARREYHRSARTCRDVFRHQYARHRSTWSRAREWYARHRFEVRLAEVALLAVVLVMEVIIWLHIKGIVR